MAAITFGTGAGTGGGTITSSGYLYCPYSAAATPCKFSGNGLCQSITFDNGLLNGRIRIWIGTFSGVDFTFDSYTEIVDIASAGATGTTTIKSPTDFTAFEVDSTKGLVFYSSSVIADGTQYDRETTGNQFYGFDATDPVYSGGITFGQGTTGRLSIYASGTAFETGDISFGTGIGAGEGDATASGYLYTPYSALDTPCLFSGKGNIDTIVFNTLTSDGRLRLWLSTFTGNSFEFVSYDEIADIDLTGKGVGTIVLTAPTDFTAFAVNTTNGLGIHSNSSAASGMQMERETRGTQRYGYFNASPVYSTDLALSQGTTGRLSIYATGPFVSFNPQAIMY